MKRLVILSLLLFLSIGGSPAAAQNRFIVRDLLGGLVLRTTCALLGCTVTEEIDGSLGKVFLVTTSATVNPVEFLLRLLTQPGIADATPDLTLHLLQSQNPSAPSGLYDRTPVNYYGTSAWDGYVNQPAGKIIKLQAAQGTFRATGAGTVAVIDTGVDPEQEVLEAVLLTGYDFTRNRSGGSEMTDVNQSTMAVVNGGSPARVNQSTMAVVNQNGVSTFSESQYAAFGHGTMVAGIVHLVAPTAQIMPLKAFHANGTGRLSDVLRAIYYGTQNHANVLSMSFDIPTYSLELALAVTYATAHGVVCVASVGNDGKRTMVYPAGLWNVMGVASTTNNDQLSSFSNYGDPPVWVAPGEAVITTYPFGTYAAGWGTSFSAPFVSGTVALLRSVNSNLNQTSASWAIAHAHYISPNAGNGRLDVDQAVSAWAH